ncbi:hypothetical protein MRB53_023729 [Persea americana]|uniref:Uncharacterized protein n=1 Tax=Persea americana TaxID=3435 RepID=A0ACC2LAF0_PERAE|nr:hypothetical protein MRB53_023729 [Persea americana]
MKNDTKSTARNTGTNGMAHASSQAIRSAVSNVDLDRTLALAEKTGREHSEGVFYGTSRVKEHLYNKLLSGYLLIVPRRQWCLLDAQPSSPRTESTIFSSPSSLRLKTGYGAAAAAGNQTQLTCTLQDDRWRRCLTVRRHVSSDVCRLLLSVRSANRDKMW